MSVEVVAQRYQRCGLCVSLLVVVWLAVGTPYGVAAETDLSARLRAHLAAGEFGPARELVAQAGGGAPSDDLLRQIAEAQSRAGLLTPALQTASAIEDDSVRDTAFGELAGQPIGGPAARGGAALADFDTLIELIQSTISPDSWDAVGGPGAVESYPGGVFVDASGLMKRLATAAESGTSLELARAAALRRTGDSDVRQASPLRKVSLTRLERQLQMQRALGRGPTEAMRNLAGLQRVQYVFVYPPSRDIVLAGPASDWQTDAEGRSVSRDSGAPLLQLDDLVVVLRNALSEHGRFGCSINPVTRNVESLQSYLGETSQAPLKPHQREAWVTGVQSRLGRQEISVFGIDARTRAAQVLVEADYRMKLVGMGLEEGTLGVVSYLDSIKVPEGGAPPPLEVLRWWFTLNYEGIRTTPARDAFELRGPGVQVLSENELLTMRGERVHTGKSSALNSQFAHSFTKHFDDLATKYPIYAELRNLFDLALVAAIISSQDLPEQVGWQLTHFGDPAKYTVRLGTAPKQVETVVNHRVIGGKHIVVGVSGGVLVDTSAFVQAHAIKTDDYGLLQGAARAAQPQGEAWWWD